MMKFKPRLMQAGSMLLLSLFLWSIGNGSSAQQARPAFRAGEVMLYCQPNTPAATVSTLATKVNAVSTTFLGLRDCYLLELPANAQDNASTLTAIANLKGDPNVRWVGPNRYSYVTQTKTEPNDTLYSQQWGLQLINMPYAWTIQKGGTGTNVCVIDSGFDTTHPDLVGQYLASSYDFGNGSSNPAPDGTGPELQHGVHVSGTIVANTNNGLGVAGICWTNIKCMGLKVHKTGDPDYALNGAALIQAYAYLLSHVEDQNIKVVNMSYGASGDPTNPNDPVYAALKPIYDKGVILVAAAGNDAADNHLVTPAGLPFVVSVAAEGPQSEIAVYSSFGKVDITAPGGDDNTTTSGSDNAALQILSTRDGAYHTEQGTSMASPHVTGVAALMMSTPGVTRDVAIAALESTANVSGLASIPDTHFGYGRLDAYAALLKVSVRATIQKPDGTDATGSPTSPIGTAIPVETYKPRITVQISLAPPQNVNVTIDDTTLTTTQIQNAIVSGNSTGSSPIYTLELALPLSTTASAVHKVVVTATNPTTNVTATDTRYFTVTPHNLNPQTEPNGILFFSTPYYETAADSPTGTLRGPADFLNNDVALYSYNAVPSASVYTEYTNSATAGTYTKPLNQAFAATTTQVPTPDTYVANTLPVGLAYFVKVGAATPYVTYGTYVENQSFRIPLHEGWNMVGDPFPYAVSFNASQIQLGNGTRIPIGQAVDQNVLQPFIYRYLGGEYQFQVLPAGVFAPWEGHWLYVNPKDPTKITGDTVVTLIVPPTQTTAVTTGKAVSLASTSTALPNVTGAGSWALQLIAHTSNLSDSYNFIGMSAATKGSYALTRVPKPPKPSPYLALGMTNDTAPGTLFAQDMRSLGGTQTWELQVHTDQTNAPVTMTWPQIHAIPRNYRLTLTDKLTGQVVDLKRQSSYQFTTTNGGTSRAFELVAHPTTAAAHALISSIVVNPGRTTSRGIGAYDIRYTTNQSATVDVTLTTIGGHTLTELATGRAAAIGENHLAWGGRDSAGRVLPAGAYILQFRATTDDGTITRETRPLLITGR